MIAARYASLLAFAQSRAFCPTGEGNGVDNSCGSSQGQPSQSFPKGSKPLRDAVDSVAPAPDQIWDRLKGLAETPTPKQIDDIANEQSSHSGAAITPEAEASYQSLVDEIGRQYEALTAAGLKARAWRGEGEPYGDPPGSTKPNSNKMRDEVAKTKEFSFFMTDKGFGTGDATPDHPMLRETKYKTADGEPMIANDLFRVVHDMVAHVRGGFSFSTNGEYNGMLTHASTLPEAAWPALFAETFGQNAVYEKTKQYAPQNAYASKLGPEIIRSELKKRGKSSRAAKNDSDEPLGYQHLKLRPWLMKDAVSSRSADCGRDDDGRFSSGNKCGGQVEMPKEDPRGRMRYDNGVQTDAARKLYQMGSSEKKLKALVDAMGGDAKNTRVDINPPSLNISVSDKDGNKLFHVDFENGRARVYPMKDLGGDDVARIRDAAVQAFGDTQADVKITVYRKAEDMKKWESENAAKIKKWEDKYAFSTLLPPHQRPKKWERSHFRAFCPTGEGGGVKNDCSPKDGSGDISPSGSTPRPPPANYVQLATGGLAPADTFSDVKGEYAGDIEHFLYQSAVAKQVGKAGVDFVADAHIKDGRRTVDSVRAISVGVQFARDAGLRIPECVLVGDTSRYTGSQAFACYTDEPPAHGPTIVFDRSLSADVISDRIKSAWLAGDSSRPLETLFTHEVSHFEHYDSIPSHMKSMWDKWTGYPQLLAQRKDAETNGRPFRPSAGTLEGLAWDSSLRVSNTSGLSFAQAMNVAGKVSAYAATNPLEFVAEFRTGVVMGGTYSDEAWALYDDYAGPKIPKRASK